MHFFGNTQSYEMQSGYTELLANHIIGNKRTKKREIAKYLASDEGHR